MSLADRIASAVIDQYDSLKPRGKPQGREWTVLAGIVAQDTRVSSLPLVVGSPAEPTKRRPVGQSSHPTFMFCSVFVMTAYADNPLPCSLAAPEPCRWKHVWRTPLILSTGKLDARRTLHAKTRRNLGVGSPSRSLDLSISLLLALGSWLVATRLSSPHPFFY